jgi:hypothetical protein
MYNKASYGAILSYILPAALHHTPPYFYLAIDTEDKR